MSRYALILFSEWVNFFKSAYLNFVQLKKNTLNYLYPQFFPRKFRGFISSLSMLTVDFFFLMSFMKLRNFPFIRTCWELNFIIIFNFYFYVFIFRDREGEKEGEEHRRERETSISCLSQAPGPGTETAAQACALSGNPTGDLLCCGKMPSQLSQTGQGQTIFIY